MKKHARLVWVAAGILCLSLPLWGGGAMAAYPERPITLLAGFAPGGSLDLSARALAKAAEKVLGRPIVIENRTGGTGTVALAAMLAQNSDGYTLCATPSSVLIRVPQMQKVPFKPLKSFRSIFGYASPPLGIVVQNDAPWKSLKDLVADAAAHPGKIKYSTTGVGSTTHAAVEEVAVKEKVRMVHVPFKGGAEALTALLGGHVEFGALTSEFIPSVKAGQTRLLATMGDQRSPKFPDVPTLKELGYDFVNDAVYAIVAPANLSPDIAKQLESAWAQAAKNEQYLAALDHLDLIPVNQDGRKFDEFLRANWKKINAHLKAAGLIAEAATAPE
ncbi:MAG: tripartite tricarboxylate transporter substrate binding protein [Deltaproteobacteria bacterium]|nr:tripartite tricarboxylate transporter substrate binding protein [Deltaproteobacteria bacterium]